MRTLFKSSLSASALTLFLAVPALAADIDRGKGDPTSAEYTTPANWSGPWIAAVGGYSILTATEDGEAVGLSAEGGFVQGELGYDFQVNNNFVVGGFICAAYSAIEGLADGYCVQGRGGFLLNRNTLLFGNVGWRWQGTDGDGEDSVYFSGPTAGLGIESKLSENAAVKVAFEHHWVTDIDGESVPDDIDLGDNRVMVGFVYRP